MTELIVSEKDRLTEKLSEHFSKNVISIDEYEKMLDLVNKIETSRDVVVAERMISTYSDMVTPQPPPYHEPYQTEEVSKKGKKQEYVSIFSTRDVTASSVNGKAGTCTSVFGTMRVRFGNLPAGKTTLKVEAIFGTVEILVPRNIKVTSNVDSIFGGTFIPEDNDRYNDYRPELHIKGEAIFGSVTVKRVD